MNERSSDLREQTGVGIGHAALAGPSGRRGRASQPRLAAEAWEALFRAQVHLMRSYTAEDIWEGLSVKEYDVLFTLSRADAAGLRLGELNQRMLISQPALSRLVDRMAERGLVRRDSVSIDGRGVLVSMTARGATVQRRIGARHVASIEQHLRVLSDDEQRMLLSLCEKLQRV